MVLMPLAVLIVLELGLRLAGFGYPTSFFIKREDGKALGTNPHFGWRFHPGEGATKPYPVALPIQKAPNTRRIFVLGESAAQGTPAPSFGFARILEAMLGQQFPDTKFEVVNAAMRGINSHVILPIARECAGQSPDLFVIYMGNNEAAGLYAPEPDAFNFTPYLRLLRTSQWIKSTKLAQAMDRLVRAVAKKNPDARPQDMELFRRKRLLPDDPRRAAVYANFRRNLEDICRAARASGAPVVVSTVAANLRDFPPLGSLHRPGLASADLAAWEGSYAKGTNAEARNLPAEAIPHYLEALKLDDHYAELHFRLGRCCQAAGRAEDARRYFTLARDWDAMQFRADTRLNEIIREIAKANQSSEVVLADCERVLAERAAGEGGLPGSGWFHDHVHFNFDGDYLVARTLLADISKALKLGASPGATNQVLSRQACAEAIGFSAWDEISVQAAMVRATTLPPYLDQLEHAERQARLEELSRQRIQQFQKDDGIRRCVEFYQTAVARRPGDWQIHFNFGNLLNDFGDNNGALTEFATVTRLMPEFLPVRVTLAECLWKARRRDEAIRHLRDALRYDSDYFPAKDALAQIGQKR